MLDDDRGGLVKFRSDASRRFQIDEIIVGKFFSLKLFRSGQTGGRFTSGDVQCGGLMRIFAVAQRLQAFKRDVHTLGKSFFCDQHRVP